MQIASTTAVSVQDAIANSVDWRSAALDLITHKIANGEPFSSGEVAAVLRTYRRDLKFSVISLGEFIRDLYWSQQMPCYDDGMGNPVYPCQVPRTTVGLGRTPAGVQVFVYAFNQADGDAHDFEVDIPDPRASAQVMPAPPSGTPVKPKVGGDKLIATVWKDGRLVIPRAAVDSFIHATGRTIQQGDQVHVEVRADKVIMTLDPTPGAKPYSLWANHGRVACTPHGAATFVPGATYKVTVDNECLIVDLTTVLV